MGALSGVTLIGIAIGAFVVIVSAQVFHEWPIADTGTGATKSGVAPAKVVDPAGGTADAATAATGIDPALRTRRPSGRAATKDTGRRHPNRDRDRGENVGSPAAPVESSPSPETGGEPSTSGGEDGSRASHPSSPGPSASTGSPSNPGPANTASAAAGGSNGRSEGPSNGGGQTGTSGGSTGTPSGGTTIETPVAAAKVPPVSEAVSETVHEVDEAALGGTLEKTGVTETTESVVEGVAGPETPVGKTVEGATEAVGGLLGGGSSGGQ